MAGLTPMMQQYKHIKANHSDAILFFRLGDFYEMFFEDAKVASDILEITLTSREAGSGNSVPMCGIPYHAAENYISRLLQSGHRVAICEQVEDPKQAVGVVKREVVRTITPGTVLEGHVVQERRSNFLASLVQLKESYGLSLLDISTGEFMMTQMDRLEELMAELVRYQPAECLLPERMVKDAIFQNFLVRDLPYMMQTQIEDWKYDVDACTKILLDHFQTHSLDGFGCRDLNAGIMACAMALGYAKDVLANSAEHVRRLRVFMVKDHVSIDKVTQRNLELLEPIHSDKTQKGTLFWVLDQTRTAMGSRLLRQWIVRPLMDKDALLDRHDGVEELIQVGLGLEKIREILGEIRDLERLVGRIHCDMANPRDFIGLQHSLKQIPSLKEKLSRFHSILLRDTQEGLVHMEDTIALIEKAIQDNPPIGIREGGIIRQHYSMELDELRDISRGGKDWIAQLQKSEIARTGIKSLKVGYNKVFGYYIEITHANQSQVPADYIRKQTLTNAERYITEELKEKEAKVLGAQEKAHQLEYALFVELRQRVKKDTALIQKIAGSVSLIDVLISLALVALQNEYVRPEMDEDGLIKIEDGRHPVLEKMLSGERFIPNDVLLDQEENQILIITGPNMAGKSTYLRQVALIVLMAQIGSFVPAKHARIGMVDKIFTRIGASDELSRGQSTFMVEMNETANILNNATSKSLIILDEIGRGTSTFDGISIAWSVAEYIHNHSDQKARTLFATHYHELTDLEITLHGVKNYNVSVKEWNEQIIFVRKIVRGGADKSYGIQVARLAGLPKAVIERAKDVLNCLEEGTLHQEEVIQFSQPRPFDQQAPLTQAMPSGSQQLTLFQGSSLLEKELKALDIDQMTPLEALLKLKEIKDRLENA